MLTLINLSLICFMEDSKCSLSPLQYSRSWERLKRGRPSRKSSAITQLGEGGRGDIAYLKVHVLHNHTIWEQRRRPYLSVAT